MGFLIFGRIFQKTDACICPINDFPGPVGMAGGGNQRPQTGDSSRFPNLDPNRFSWADA